MESWKNKAFNSIDYHRKHKASNIANRTKGQCRACWDYNQTKAIYYLPFLKNSHSKHTTIYHPEINVKPYAMRPFIDYYPIDDEENPLINPPKQDSFKKQPQTIIATPYHDANKWGNQQRRKKIEMKRAFGRYYRMKENKTWKWKLQKRRRSKRRNLIERGFDDDYDQYDETDFCKITQIISKPNSYSSMTSYSYIYNYSGFWFDTPHSCIYCITVECHSCCSLVYIRNEVQSLSNTDSNGHRIYHYSITHDKINAKNKHYFHFINGEYCRIFCNDCTMNKIISCCFRGCRVKEILTNLCKTIEIQDNKKGFYGRYFVCDNHRKCKVCDKPYSYNDTDYWELNEYQVNKCKKCNEYICNNCMLHGICIICIDKNQFNILYNILFNVLDITAIHIIKNYCNGHFIVTCCALNICANSMYIKDILSLTGDNALYSYVSNDCAAGNAIHIFDQELIIFCKNCTETKLCKCRYLNCNNKEAASHICQIHPFCNICKNRFDPWEYDPSFIHCYDRIDEELKTKCLKCNLHTCCYCIFHGMCKICIEKTHFDTIRSILDCNIGKILNMHLMDIIAYHCCGYFKVKCCNLYDCNDYIDIKNTDSLFQYADAYGMDIYFYSANRYSLENSVYIYGYPLIIFCAKCTKQKLKKCEFHKFILQRAFGNDIYNKSRCYNFEASHILCQIHPDHHKTKSKANVDDIIKKQKKLKRAQKEKDRKRPMDRRRSSATWIRNDYSALRLTPISASDFMRMNEKYRDQVSRNKKIKLRDSRLKKKYKPSKNETQTDALFNGSKNIKGRKHNNESYFQIYTHLTWTWND